MKHPGYSRVVDILRERELELFAIRSNFEQLQDKFFQLENAFRINLDVQRRLESELVLCKPGKAAKKSNTKSFDEVDEKKIKARAVFFSRLTKLRNEKKRWKDAFHRQTKITERWEFWKTRTVNTEDLTTRPHDYKSEKHIEKLEMGCRFSPKGKYKLEHEQSIETIRDECERILKSCRESGENHFRELLKLYEDSNGKGRYLEAALNDSQIRATSTRKRILELANLLETLEKFQGVRTEVVCQRVAKALRSLASEEEKPYEEDMRHLRQVTWDADENDKNGQTHEFLQAQNSVLREVVKSLKRKLHEKFHEVPAYDENANEAEKNTLRENLIEFPRDESVEKSQEESAENTSVFLCHKTEEVQPHTGVEKSTETGEKENRENKKSGCGESSVQRRISGARSSLSNEITTDSQESEKESKQSRIRDRTLKQMYVDAFESHRNGIPYVEYTIHFFNDRQIRVRQSKILTQRNSRMVVEFVDSEKDFESASIDRTVFYLGDNVERIVSVKDSGVNCSMQTNRVKTLEKFIQTKITGTTGFSKVNAGVGILNSEKRAMERSLVNLECTVANLKADALGQARSMIKSDAKVLGDEFFNCVKRLER